MSDNYNANIYLATKDLNNIEDRIENITEECQEKIFGKDDGIYSGTNFQIETVSSDSGELEYVKGQTSQSGTPTPTTPQPINITTGSQVVSVCGKNLLPNNATTQTINGITYTINEDKSIKINGTARGRADLWLYGSITDTGNYVFIPKGNYTMNTANLNDGTMFISFREKTAGVRYMTRQNNGLLTLLSQQDCYFYGIMLAVESGKTINNLTFYPQLEKGNQPTTYEEYKGNDYEINLGKNLLDLSGFITHNNYGGLNISYSNGKLLIDGTATGNVDMYLLSTGWNTKAQELSNIINSQISYLTLSSTKSGLIYYFQMNGAYIQNTINRANPTDNITNMFVRIPRGTTLNNEEIGIQLERENVATSYTPYKTPIYLGKIGNYKDYIFRNTTENPLYDSNLEEGQWYIHKEIGRVVLNGSENWNVYDTTYKRLNLLLSDASTISARTMCYSNYFKFSSSSNDVGTCFTNGGRIYLYPTLDINTTALFKTWLSTHNTEVYYILNTPTNTLIEDEELINQLNSIELLEGLNNVSVSSPYLSGVIGIQKHFSNALRNIKVGDDLSGKTLYLSFPRTIYENIPDIDTATHIFIAIATNNTVIGICYRYYPNSNKAIGVRLKDDSSETGYIIKYLYSYSLITDNGNPYLNYVRFTLPLDYGVVTSIDANSEFYQYVKIYDESVIPNYTKHTWVDNEQLTMQKIDNIEQGVRNIGRYYEKPNGWVQEKEWLPDSNKNYAGNYGVGIKTISYQDLNRWYNNLDLIDFNDLNDITIWNAVNDISQIEWNGESDEEWVDNFIINVYELITEDDNTLITEDNNVIEVTTSERI